MLFLFWMDLKNQLLSMVVSQVTNDPLQNAKKKAFEKNMRKWTRRKKNDVTTNHPSCFNVTPPQLSLRSDKSNSVNKL